MVSQLVQVVWGQFVLYKWWVWLEDDEFSNLLLHTNKRYIYIYIYVYMSCTAKYLSFL